MRRIDIDDLTDRHRYRCPRGHTAWEATNGHFYCTSCARAWDVDPAFDELRDKATGDMIERDDVELVTDAGPYKELETERQL